MHLATQENKLKFVVYVAEIKSDISTKTMCFELFFVVSIAISLSLKTYLRSPFIHKYTLILKYDSKI